MRRKRLTGAVAARARVERGRVVQHVAREAFAIDCRSPRRPIGRAKNLVAPRELLRDQQPPGSQLAGRDGRSLVGGKFMDGNLVNADALFDDNAMLAPHCDGAWLDLEPEE